MHNIRSILPSLQDERIHTPGNEPVLSFPSHPFPSTHGPLAAGSQVRDEDGVGGGKKK